MKPNDIASKAAEELHEYFEWVRNDPLRIPDSDKTESIILRAIESAQPTDTKRLDWLEQADNTLRIEWVGTGNSIRAAIDAAMKHHNQ